MSQVGGTDTATIIGANLLHTRSRVTSTRRTPAARQWHGSSCLEQLEASNSHNPSSFFSKWSHIICLGDDGVKPYHLCRCRLSIRIPHRRRRAGGSTLRRARRAREGLGRAGRSSRCTGGRGWGTWPETKHSPAPKS